MVDLATQLPNEKPPGIETQTMRWMLANPVEPNQINLKKVSLYHSIPATRTNDSQLRIRNGKARVTTQPEPESHVISRFNHRGPE